MVFDILTTTEIALFEKITVANTVLEREQIEQTIEKTMQDVLLYSSVKKCFQQFRLRIYYSKLKNNQQVKNKEYMYHL
jgi:hypothetical protein